ncbi:hypothetical protein ACIBL6_29555 [Streptomyces sp. NPDC050400]|uniref:hypothetical protein n=1 Tax=Streptomyces sp. NPDC050400 TaxID=3365610 RepID=UPI0037B1F8B0
MTGRRWDRVLSRVTVADVGKQQARAARVLPADVTVFTSDVDDLARLVPHRIVVRKV